MRDECRELKRTNEELQVRRGREKREKGKMIQAQLLHESFERGRCLLEDGGGASLMDELAGKDTTEVRKTVYREDTEDLAVDRSPPRTRSVQSEVESVYQWNSWKSHREISRDSRDSMHGTAVIERFGR